MTDFRLAKHVTDMQIQKDIDRDMARQAELMKKELELEEKQEMIDGIIATAIVILLVIIGGFVDAI